MKITHYFKLTEENQSSSKRNQNVNLSDNLENVSEQNALEKQPSLEILTPKASNLTKKEKKKRKLENVENNNKRLKKKKSLKNDENKKIKKKKVLSNESTTNEQNLLSNDSICSTSLKSQSQKQIDLFFSPNLSILKSTENVNVINEAKPLVVSVLTDEERKLMEDERRAKMLQNGTRRLEKAILTLNKGLFIKILRTMTRLPERYIEKISNPFIKYALQKEAAQKKRIAIMKNMTKEERSEFRKKTNFDVNLEFEILLEKFLLEKYEDTNLELKEFCDIPLVILPHKDATSEQFDQCLIISEFVYVNKKLLNTKLNFSADKLLSALYSKKSGYELIVAPILTVLLTFLVRDGYKSKSKKIRYIETLLRIGSKGLLKAIQLLLCNNKAVILTRKRSKSYNENSVDSDELPISLIENICFHVDFYNICVDNQLKILLILIDKIMSRESYLNFIVDTSEINKAMQDLKNTETEINEMVQSLKHLPIGLSEDELLKLSRVESAEYTKNVKLRQKIESDIEVLRENALIKMQLIKNLKQINRLRIVPIGTDRFHRNYWYFNNSPNKGIFIEDIKYAKKIENANTKKLKNFLTILEENVNGKFIENEILTREWRLIDNTEQFNTLINCLCIKGIREGNLYQKLNLISNDFFNSIEIINL